MNDAQDVSEEQVREVMEEFGEVDSVCLREEAASGRSLGIAVVHMHTKEEGKRAVDGLKGRKLAETGEKEVVVEEWTALNELKMIASCGQFYHTRTKETYTRELEEMMSGTRRLTRSEKERKATKRGRSKSRSRSRSRRRHSHSRDRKKDRSKSRRKNRHSRSRSRHDRKHRSSSRKKDKKAKSDRKKRDRSEHRHKSRK